MSLCLRCRHSWNFTRTNGQRRFMCHSDGQQVEVPGDIVQCSDFQDRAVPDKWDMEKIAWTIKTDATGRVRGFEPPPPKPEGT